jgi:plastocyanin
MTVTPRLALFCGLAALALPALAVNVTVQVADTAGKPLLDAVVYAELLGGGAVPQTLKPGEIEQRGLKFLPLVTVVQTGSRIAFPNNDRVKHHIYSFSTPKKFDQKLYSGAAAATQVFDKPGTVVLGCNIHDRMLAYVKVVDTPFYGKTDAAGTVTLDLPPGAKMTLKAWYFNAKSDASAEQPLAVAAGAAPVSFKLAVKPPVAEQPAGDPYY